MDVRGRRILIFGDSLTHRGARDAPDAVEVVEPSHRASSSPGDLLASLLLEAGAAGARLNAKVGRSAWSFFRNEAWREIVPAELQHRPERVLVMLGTNDLGLVARLDAQAFARLRDELAAGGAEVWAIGPPAFASAEMTGQAAVVYDSLRQVFGGRLIDLRPLTADLVVAGRAGDRVHFSAAGAPVVARRLLEALQAPPSRARGWLLALGVGLGGAALIALAALSTRKR